MGKITVFALETCPYCKKAKALLKQKGANFEEVSITAKPEWRQYMFLLANGEHASILSDLKLIVLAWYKYKVSGFST